MSSIKIMPLGSFLTVSKGKKYTISQSPSSTSHRYIQIDDLRNNNNLVFTDDLNGITVTANDLIIAWDGANAGTVGYGLIGKIGSTLARLRINPKYDIETRYVGYFLKSKFREIRKHCTGATIPHVSKNFLLNLSIPLPEKNIQKKISNILDKADNIRQKRKQAIKLADDFLRATFLAMFGDPVTNPKGWDVKPLVSLVVGKFQNGAYFPRDKYSKYGIEMVHMTDAFYDIIQRGSLKRVQASDADIVKYILTHEDLMISRRSLNYEGAAKPSLIPQSDEPLIFESSMIRITPDKNQIDKRFLFHYLSDPLVKDHFIRKFVTGATIKGISQKNLEQVRVIVPPMEQQKKFLGIVHMLEKYKQKLGESAIGITGMFSALSQRAFLDQL
ncbi:MULTISPECIES: restriction endonuclease subunit S [Arsenophonus]|uniref:restriction endonuclease subunit S n=1 Tax=Arsenophonus TaxID=637 RepID=UPI0015D7EA9C|nr:MULTISPECIES: restriction endonuclease subunit S [Arsenophonus]UBX29434.1 restriction endonuclease subunit S [Arsenophonus apicola]